MEKFIVKKNIVIVLLSVVALVCFGGWVISAREAHSNAVVMHSEAKIIREHVINQKSGQENNN